MNSKNGNRFNESYTETVMVVLIQKVNFCPLFILPGQPFLIYKNGLQNWV
uniref:Uncharacterized protein n=1 Tax=Arundo donax TaxID=35708 RepID=A0A0A9AEV6_ARUDO